MIKQYKLNNQTFYKIQISYTSTSGQRYQNKFRLDRNGFRITSRRIAEQLKVEYRNELISKVEKDYSELSFSEYHERFLENSKATYKASTLAQYNGDLKKWLSKPFRNKKLSNICKQDVHDLIFSYTEELGASSKTQKKILKSLHKIFETAVEDDYIVKNPAKGFKVKTEPPKREVLSESESNILIREARRVNHPFYFHWIFALNTGMRNGELYALRWKDVDFDKEAITIRASWGNKNGYSTTKNNEIRTCPINDFLQHALLELKREGGYSENLKGLNGSEFQCDDLVLPRLTQWKNGEQSKVLKGFLESIGLKAVKFHDLRATFITNILGNGAAMPPVMSIVGHKQSSTTDVYLRLSGISNKGITNKLGFKRPDLNEGKLLKLHSDTSSNVTENYPTKPNTFNYSRLNA